MPRKQRPTCLVSWSQSATATGYKLFWGTTSNRVYPYMQDVGNNLEYRLQNLNRSTTYYFSAKAYNEAGDSPFSPQTSWHT